jgi:hypothetical protein
VDGKKEPDEEQGCDSNAVIPTSSLRQIHSATNGCYTPKQGVEDMGSKAETQDLRTPEHVSIVESGNYIVTVSSFTKGSGAPTLEKLVTDFITAGVFAQLHRKINVRRLKTANAMRPDAGQEVMK